MERPKVTHKLYIDWAVEHDQLSTACGLQVRQPDRSTSKLWFDVTCEACLARIPEILRRAMLREDPLD